jgi:hypothetical protein
MNNKRNALYQITAEYLRNQPDAKPADVWRHFSAIGSTGLHEVIVAFDAERDVLTYHPNAGGKPRTITKSSFTRNAANQIP